MNEAWTWQPLGELFEIGTGKTMSAAAREGADKTPFLRTSNVLWNEIDLSSIDKISIPEQELRTKLLRRGDLLVCEGGEIGRAAIWNGEVKPMSFQNHLHRLRPIDPSVEPRFYVFFLQCAFTQLGLYEGAGNKTTIPNLSRSRLAKLEVPKPLLVEQQTISYILSKVRSAIKVQDQHIAITQSLKHATMYTLFTRGLRGESQKETEIGKIPEGWKVVQLETLCKKTDTVDLSTEANSVVDYVDVSSISREYLKIEMTTRHVLRDAPSRARKRILAGDVIFATVRPTLLRVAIVPDELDNQVCSTAFCVLRGNQENAEARFIYYIVQHEQFIQQLRMIETGASYPAVSDRMVKKQLVPMPTMAEQRTIVTILDAIDRKIDLHRRKKAVLEELFETLLHNLITGEIRIQCLDLSMILGREHV